MRYKKYFRKTSLKQKGHGDFLLNEVKKKKPKNFFRDRSFSWSHCTEYL